MNYVRYPIAFLALLVSALSAAPARIGVLLKDRDLFWSAAAKGAEDAAKQAGVELIVKAPPVPNALAQQTAMLDALAKEQIDALIIAPLSETAFKAQLTALAAKGVKIVALDTNVADGLAKTYLGYNQAVMAEDAAKYAAGLIGENDNAALLRAYSIEGMSLREKTLLSAFKADHPKGTLHSDVFAGSERGDDYAKSVMLLEKHPDAKVVITPFSAATLAMTKAIQEKGLSGKILHVGFGSMLPDDVVVAIQKGAMQGWVAQQPKLFGSKGVEAAIQLVEGKSVPATIDVPYYIVSKANLQDPQVQAIRN